MAVLKKMGFAEKWCNWIFQCISTVSYRVIINEVPSGLITLTRGIRYGDPLSPYLFILMLEALTRLIDRRVANGCIKGLKMNRRCPAITHLFFANDTIIFGGASLEETKQWEETLELYCRVSGQKINFHKSSVRFSVNCVPELK